MPRVVRTVCGGCMCECGVLAHVADDGRVVRLEGDPNHPLSEGYMCPKGLSFLQTLYHPDRLKHPLKRVGEKGEGKWRRISWEEALEEVCSKLLEIKEKYGPESISISYGTYPKRVAVGLSIFLASLGSPNQLIGNCHYCYTPHLTADLLTCGEAYTCELGVPDFRVSRCVVLWGYNPVHTFPALGKRIVEAKKRGAKLIVIDPRFTELASMADLWLQVRPGTDGALALGMLNVVINERLYDADFVERWCYGFNALAERAQEYPPEKVEEITWVPRQQIVEAARLYATLKPAALHSHLGVSMSYNSVQASRAISILVAITGNLNVRGGAELPQYPIKLTYMNLKRQLRLPPEVEGKTIGAHKYPLLSGPTSFRCLPHPPSVFEAMLTGKPYPIKALVATSNLAVNFEGTREVVEALKKLELLVVMDFFMTPTAELADYVLPSATYLECEDICDAFCYTNFIAARQRVIEPLHECRDDNEVLFELMRRMKLKIPFPVSSYRELLDYRLRELGLTFEDFKKKGYIASEVLAERRYERGMLREDGKPGFRTPTGKCELYSTLLEKYGYDPLPEYVEPPESPYSTPELASEYPLILITGSRHIASYQSMGHNVPYLRELLPNPLLEMHPQTASAYGIEEGDWVYVETPMSKGKVKLKAFLSYGINPRVVSAQALWWYPEGETYEDRAVKYNVNSIIPMKPPYGYEPIVGTRVLRGLLCRVRRAGGE
ncbi:MAG: molybdopterin-dependent oxidoreductase [Candidatus Nezhaarchaeota archaeon]|nr:molybdopterin-dependent oxidoreductase [Candidatus Nezhaarchaeota archaeon]